MYVSDELIYIQLQKTGSTHITRILAHLMDGYSQGLHIPASPDKINSEKYFISSIRNPWDWYVSLWSFGVMGLGLVRYHLTKRDIWLFFRRAIKDPRRNFPLILHEMTKDVHSWRLLYDRLENRKSFRAWLKKLHDPDSGGLQMEGFKPGTTSNGVGLFTHRYLSLCCKNNQTPREISSYSELEKFESDNCYIDYFIRLENLEEDLCKALEKVQPLDSSERAFIYGLTKTNPSKKILPTPAYYDQSSIELVRRQDRLLIEKFNYAPPC